MPSITEKKIFDIISPSIEGLGYRLVRVRLNDGKYATLQIMAERMTDFDLGIDDCEKISRNISAILDVEDPISSAYRLEVSSPGIDRPLVRLEDFVRYVGFEVKASTEYAINNRKRYTGKVVSVVDNVVTIASEDGSGNHEVPFEAFSTAKLILTDDLIAYARTQKQQQVNDEFVEPILEKKETKKSKTNQGA